MPSLKIRYQFWFLALIIMMALFLIFLSLYTNSFYRVILAVIWLIIGLNNAFNNAILEVNETEIILRNGLGIVTKRYAYQEGRVRVSDKEIYFNEERIYKHSFTFSRDDFELIREYLTLKNPELNLDRHLVDDD